MTPVRAMWLGALMAAAAMATREGLAPAFAETVEPPSISPPDTWVQRDSGTLRVLNKLDSTVRTVTLHVGETTQLQTLSITLAACAVRPPDLPADATAHLKVSDSQQDQPGYDGWILEQEPAINLFENPVYDIQLAGCGEVPATK